ncbi:hypothetical protein I3843_02G068800 [Carya illinoinensis]|uniref:E3 ubiquitin-protein ligase LIN-1 n=1 Tax=Carya illinoinensis TaxID=32201 RepID=A0A922JZ24_CARIL|nr:putative E3 ubiquitin-protein ligase LIN-1 isoform X2 [Carya illinoinensis]KAG6726443.1 hypothetical protein I3842_02G081000 [Carya illinoinensis]KAG7991307.1 hypothetical protein I3843_02G068800 [Carya illinoinensis]
MNMSSNSMVPISSFLSSSSSSSSFCSTSIVPSNDYERPDISSIQVLVVSINNYITELLGNAEARSSLHLICTSKLKYQKQEFFKFDEQSVLANFYWGINSIESAIQTKMLEETDSRLRKSEQMLQVPALLDKQDFTAGVPNRHLVCCSYFYLSVVSNLQKDEWQAALYFIQALLVYPKLVRTALAPRLCESIIPSRPVDEKKEIIRERSLGSTYLVASEEDDYSDQIRQMARSYKDWLIYYQVMSYGRTPRWHCGCRDIPSRDRKSQYKTHTIPASSESLSSIEQGQLSMRNYYNVHPLDPHDVIDQMVEKPKASAEVPEYEDHRNPSIRCLKELVQESQSDATASVGSWYDDSFYESDMEADMDGTKCSGRIPTINAVDRRPEVCDQKVQSPCSTSEPELTALSLPCAPKNPMPNIEAISELSATIMQDRDKKSYTIRNIHADKESNQTLNPHKFLFFDHIASSTSLQKHRITLTNHQGSHARDIQNSSSWKSFNKVSSHSGKDSTSELLGIFEKTIPKLCFFGGLGKSDDDYAEEVAKFYKMLNNKTEIKYGMFKDVILDQLLAGISTSKEERVIRASVSILTAIISANKSAIEDIKKKGLQLHVLASALKQNVHEAAILIYLINPSPGEIKTLEILPALVEVVCTPGSYKGGMASLLPTPPGASLKIIEVLVTAFDYTTNNKHLAAISSPCIISRLLDVARTNNLNEFLSLATVLIKCMQFDGQCRKYILQFTPVTRFILLLQSNKNHDKFIALEFFHEILRIPRSSAISLLQKIQKEGSTDIMHKLMDCLQQLQPEYQLLAANVLLQLDTMNNSPGRSVFGEEAMKVVRKHLASEEGSSMQLLSAYILSNLGGTYAWTGEPYTVAWLVKKTGLASPYHCNMLRNFNWLDKSLQDAFTDSWCSRISRSIINIGNPIFHALEKGLKSKIRIVSRACLITIAWLGCEITKCPDGIRNSACEILLSGIEQFLHPGLELEDRLLACLCIYNYASGKGMQKVIYFSEGVKESLRRLSSITWMAEELHKVINYYQPNKSRISCVHTQIMESGLKCNGAVCALIYYKGLLYSGYSDGSIKVWDIKGQSAMLVWNMKEHKKAVTCFSLFEPGDSLLSGSVDKTIRVWQIIHRKLECIEVIAVKEPVQHMDAYGEMIFVVTHGHGLKVFDESRTVKEIGKNKNVKCMRVFQEKIYVGCTNSSIQEFSTTNDRKHEIKARAKGWKSQKKPVNSIVAYKDWLYCAGATVEGSSFKEWRRQCKPQMSIAIDKGDHVLAMGVVEDFIYLNCSSSTHYIQIWLRETHKKLGRISAGSRITSLLTANDMVLCGTESGLIKGWIPL